MNLPPPPPVQTVSLIDQLLSEGVDAAASIAGHDAVIRTGGRNVTLTVIDEGPVSDIGLDGRVITYARKVFLRKDEAPDSLAQDDRVTIGDEVFYIAEIREAGGVIVDLFLSESAIGGSQQ